MPVGIAQSERQALCSLLEDKGPLAPTLCEGWTTADLAAHLFIRENRPLAAPGIVLKPLKGVADRAMDTAKRSLGYGGLVSRVRSGPPMPFKLIDEKFNTLEYFVHHEDVRRAGEDVPAREDPSLDEALWAVVKRGARLLSRRVSGAGLELSAPGFGVVRAHSGEPLATMS
ncbi:MAG: TIGR03085 family metal-binding protein [Acidimicrobiales bacterium]